jgi:hypothetical protein
MADDEIWASDEDNDQVFYDQMIAQREWEKMNEVHGNVSTVFSLCGERERYKHCACPGELE